MNPGCFEIGGLHDFDINQIFDCGQSFRFSADPAGGISGVAMGRFVRFEQPSPDTLRIYGATREDFESVWKNYLSLDTDYSAIKKSFAGDSVLLRAAEYGGGIRILRQEPEEALFTFILSQNNNIPRIKKNVAELSRRFGEPFEACGQTRYAFPTAKALYSAGIDALFDCRIGFRAKYIYDAAERLTNGALSIEEIAAADTPEAERLLCTVKGVGVKVASCTLLFGFSRYDCFPVDVHISRVLEKYYPEGADPASFGSYAGIAQQYLFYYERWKGDAG